MLPQKTFLTKKYDVTETFFDGNVVKISQVMSCIEDISKSHAELLGFGFDDLIKHNLLWVISKAKIVFHKQLTPDVKTLVITTWPSKNRKCFCTRYCVAYDQNGQMVFSSAYVWLMIDKDSRAIASPKIVDNVYNCDFDEATATDGKFSKVAFDQNTFREVGKHLMQKGYLDDNGHVNNKHYMDFALLGEDDAVTQVQIAYHHELFVGDEIIIYKLKEGNVRQVCGITADEVTSFTARYEVL